MPQGDGGGAAPGQGVSGAGGAGVRGGGHHAAAGVRGNHRGVRATGWGGAKAGAGGGCVAFMAACSAHASEIRRSHTPTPTTVPVTAHSNPPASCLLLCRLRSLPGRCWRTWAPPTWPRWWTQWRRWRCRSASPSGWWVMQGDSARAIGGVWEDGWKSSTGCTRASRLGLLRVQEWEGGLGR